MASVTSQKVACVSPSPKGFDTDLGQLGWLLQECRAMFSGQHRGDDMCAGGKGKSLDRWNKRLCTVTIDNCPEERDDA